MSDQQHSQISLNPETKPNYAKRKTENPELPRIHYSEAEPRESHADYWPWIF
jgi:hypothetical protein